MTCEFAKYGLRLLVIVLKLTGFDEYLTAKIIPKPSARIAVK